VIGIAWYLTDRVIEPRLQNVEVDGDPAEIPKFEELDEQQTKALRWGTATLVLGMVLLVAVLWPESSPLRDADGNLATFAAPVMQSIVPIIFLLFLFPGVVYGYVSGTYKSSSDMINSMTKAMQGMSYYIVMAFFCALFIDAFGKSNLGALMAIEGAEFLKALSLPAIGRGVLSALREINRNRHFALLNVTF